MSVTAKALRQHRVFPRLAAIVLAPACLVLPPGVDASGSSNRLASAGVAYGATFGAVDTDGDGIADHLDNCLTTANSDQRDTDADGLGNVCDADFNNDCAINFPDLNLLKADFFATGDLDTDLDGNGSVNFVDLSIMKALFFGSPGPGGPANLCCDNAYYIDTDGDGFGESEVTASSCIAPPGFAPVGGDCDPIDPDTYPGAPELCDGIDNDCDPATVRNCDVGEPCNFPGPADQCADEAVCTCQIDATGSCTGNYVCSGYCNSSETGAVGEFCTADQICNLSLLQSANVHSCSFVTDPPGTTPGGQPCEVSGDCRSLSCDRVCVGPGCAQNYCQDFCGSDDYCPGAGALCRLLRTTGSIDGRCWPAGGPALGAGAIGAACTSDNQCDHGFCADDAGTRYCTQPCCSEGGCPSGYTCSLQGDQIQTNAAYAAPDAPACNDSVECATGLCFDGRCAWRLTETAPVCLADVGAQGMLPAGSACTENSQCRGNFCDAGAGVCVEPCCGDGDCPDGLSCRLRYTQVTAAAGQSRATRARVCVDTAGNSVLQRLP